MKFFFYTVPLINEYFVAKKMMINSKSWRRKRCDFFWAREAKDLRARFACLVNPGALDDHADPVMTYKNHFSHRINIAIIIIYS